MRLQFGSDAKAIPFDLEDSWRQVRSKLSITSPVQLEWLSGGDGDGAAGDNLTLVKSGDTMHD